MASSTLRQQQTSQPYKYDFCVVCYNTDQVTENSDYEDGRKSLKFVKTLVKLLENITCPYGSNKRKLKGYYADRDLLPGRMIINEHFQVLGQSRYTIVVLSPAFIRDRWSEYIGQSAFKALIGTSRFVPLAIHGVQPTDSGIPEQLNVASIVYFRQGESPEEDQCAWTKVKKTVLCENPESGPIVSDRGGSGEGYTDNNRSSHPSPTHHGNDLDPVRSLSCSARSPLSVRDASLPTLEAPPTYSLGDVENEIASAQISVHSDNLGNDGDNQGQVPGNDVSEDEPRPTDYVRGDQEARLGSNHPQNTPEAAADNENAENGPTSPDQTIPSGDIPISLNLQEGGGAEGDSVQGSVNVTVQWNPLQGFSNTLHSISRSLSDNPGL